MQERKRLAKHEMRIQIAEAKIQIKSQRKY